MGESRQAPEAPNGSHIELRGEDCAMRGTLTSQSLSTLWDPDLGKSTEAGSSLFTSVM